MLVRGILINKEDIDLGKGVIQFRHQISTIRGKGLVVTEPKTDKARRAVTLPESTKKYLEEHLWGRGWSDLHDFYRQADFAKKLTSTLQAGD